METSEAGWRVRIYERLPLGSPFSQFRNVRFRVLLRSSAVTECVPAGSGEVVNRAAQRKWTDFRSSEAAQQVYC